MCNDPLIEKLKEYGFNPISLPRAGIRPLQILSKDGKELTRLGDLDSLLAGDPAGLPPVDADLPAAQIKVRKTGKVKGGLAITVLGNFLKAMGAKGLGLSSQVKRSKDLVFGFEDVKEDRIDIAVLDTYLTNADVNPESRYLRQLLESEGIYIVTSILKSRKFSIETGGAASSDSKLDADAIKGVVGAGVNVSSSGESGNSVTFEGPEDLTFAFQAVQLNYYDGRYATLKPASKVILKAAAKAPKNPRADYYQSRGLFGPIEEAEEARATGRA
jgi:hypothetical protein